MQGGGGVNIGETKNIISLLTDDIISFLEQADICLDWKRMNITRGIKEYIKTQSLSLNKSRISFNEVPRCN